MTLQNRAVAVGCFGILRLLFQRHCRAKRRWLVVMDEQSSVPAAVPCLLQTLERQPARLSIAELSSDQLALGIEAVNDDVVKEVVRLAGSEDLVLEATGKQV